MENMIKKHLKKFGFKPTVIGIFWDDPNSVIYNIAKAIETNNPYDEYEMLSDDEKKAFDKGELLF